MVHKLRNKATKVLETVVLADERGVQQLSRWQKPARSACVKGHVDSSLPKQLAPLQLFSKKLQHGLYAGSTVWPANGHTASGEGGP
jgi:hypothetical protein